MRTIRLLLRLLFVVVVISAIAYIFEPQLALFTVHESPSIFHGSSRTVSASERRAILHTKTWQPVCPIPIDQLRVVTISYWGFDHKAHIGKLMVNKSVTGKVVSAFHTMFNARYLIRQVRLVEEFNGSDEASMRADNSSGFNCRRSPIDGEWSLHAYGLAIDINPLENPEIIDHTRIDPPSARKYADRAIRVTGTIRAGDAAVRAFQSIGWTWGGTWKDGWQDWQHFYLHQN